MKIDRDKPLPDHTIIDYNECCALLTLQELFPDKYRGLQLKDKPDLQGKDVGIEVTAADDSKHQEMLNNWVKAVYSDDAKEKQRHINRMEELGTPFMGGFQSWPGYYPTVDLVQDAVKRKIEKLKKGGYKLFERYELFISTEVDINDKNKDLLKVFFDSCSAFDEYKTIYVFEKGYLLHCFDVNGAQTVEISISEQTDRNIRARRIIEQVEERSDSEV